METQRETVNFETLNGHKLVIKAYITGSEFEEIQKCYTEGMKVRIDEVTSRPIIEGINSQGDYAAKSKTIEILVVSVDGNIDDITKRVKDLRNEDYQQVLEKLDEITGKKKRKIQKRNYRICQRPFDRRNAYGCYLRKIWVDIL